MEVKKCKTCKVEKVLSEYTKCKSSKDKLSYDCSSCRKEVRLKYKEKAFIRNKEYRIENREKRYLYNKDYWAKNKEQVALTVSKWQEKNAEKIIANRKRYNQENKEKQSQYRLAYERKHKDRINARKQKTRDENRERYNGYARKHREIHKDRITKREKEREESDPIFKLKRRLRSSIGNAIRKKGFSKRSKTYEILGCTYEFFIEYFESQFKKGMTWENIHIDHIVPLDSVNTEEEVIALNHYTNLQPLFGLDNILKANKIIEKQLRLL